MNNIMAGLLELDNNHNAQRHIPSRCSLYRDLGYTQSFQEYGTGLFGILG